MVQRLSSCLEPAVDPRSPWHHPPALREAQDFGVSEGGAHGWWGGASHIENTQRNRIHSNPDQRM